MQPVLFGNPVEKTHNSVTTSIFHASDFLVCYQIVPQAFNITVQTNNQFGPGNLPINPADLLCVPSQKNGFVEATPTPGERHGNRHGDRNGNGDCHRYGHSDLDCDRHRHSDGHRHSHLHADGDRYGDTDGSRTALTLHRRRPLPRFPRDGRPKTTWSRSGNRHSSSMRRLAHLPVATGNTSADLADAFGADWCTRIDPGTGRKAVLWAVVGGRQIAASGDPANALYSTNPSSIPWAPSRRRRAILHFDSDHSARQHVCG